MRDVSEQSMSHYEQVAKLLECNSKNHNSSQSL